VTLSGSRTISVQWKRGANTGRIRRIELEVWPV
jgi:hypothetical protein